MSLQGVIDAADTTIQTSERLSRSFARALASVLRGLERSLIGVVTDASAGSPTAIVKAARANRTRVELRQALTEAGYDDLADSATAGPLDAITKAILASRPAALEGAGLSSSALSKLEALKSLYATNLLDQGDDVARALWQATVRGVFGAQPVTRIVQDLANVLDDTAPHIQTLYDTSVSIYARQVEALQAGQDPEARFAYFGPVDEKTRPFCLKWAGKVLTRTMIDTLDNGQLDNVFLTGGGYNCRHLWLEVSKFSALSPLVGTDERVPEIQAAFADLPEAA